MALPDSEQVNGQPFGLSNSFEISVPIQFLFDPRLTERERRVLIMIHSLHRRAVETGNANGCYASGASIGEALGIDQSDTNRAIRRGIEFGYLRRVSRRDQRKRSLLQSTFIEPAKSGRRHSEMSERSNDRSGCKADKSGCEPAKSGRWHLGHLKKKGRKTRARDGDVERNADERPPLSTGGRSPASKVDAAASHDRVMRELNQRDLAGEELGQAQAAALAIWRQSKPEGEPCASG